MISRALEGLALGAVVRALPPDVRAAYDAHVADIDASPTFDRAIVAGAGAPSVSVAFALGYQAALHSLVPSLLPGELASLCATEAKGGHPRAIECTFSTTPTGGHSDGKLRGKKVWATLSPVADVLFVLASRGEVDGRKDFALVRVSRTAPGVHVAPMPPTPFAPDVPHAEVVFDDAAGVALRGDGFSDYVRAFRTVEDLHVVAAVGAHLVQRARALSLPDVLTLPALAALSALSLAATASPRDPVAHLVIAGALPSLTAAWQAIASAAGDRAPDLSRDAALLSIANKARELRTAAALSNIHRP